MPVMRSLVTVLRFTPGVRTRSHRASQQSTQWAALTKKKKVFRALQIATHFSQYIINSDSSSGISRSTEHCAGSLTHTAPPLSTFVSNQLALCLAVSLDGCTVLQSLVHRFLTNMDNCEEKNQASALSHIQKRCFSEQIGICSPTLSHSFPHVAMDVLFLKAHQTGTTFYEETLHNPSMLYLGSGVFGGAFSIGVKPQMPCCRQRSLKKPSYPRWKCLSWEG